MRIAVLALLAEEPRHGYAVITELAERSGGMWRPSPGSVYPVLQLLQDEGLVSVEEAGGKRVFSLTTAGRDLVEADPRRFDEPWQVADRHGRERFRVVFEGLGGVAAAAREVARHGSPEQAERAAAVLDRARRGLYALLAEEPVPTEPRSTEAQANTEGPGSTGTSVAL